MIGSRKSKGRRTIGVFRRVTRAIRSALPWGLGEPGPDSGASVSIRRHIIAGSILVGALVLGLGGWAATAQISGALIAQGSIVVDSNVKKVQHPTGGVVGELFVRDGDHEGWRHFVAARRLPNCRSRLPGLGAQQNAKVQGIGLVEQELCVPGAAFSGRDGLAA